MSIITLNCITNWMSDAPAAEEFEALLVSYQDYINQRLDSFEPHSELENIYVQFQYDCTRLPSSAKTLKIGRYSSAKRHIEAYVPIGSSEFENVDELSRKKIIGSELIRALKAIESKLKDKIENYFDELIEEVEAANEDMMS